MGWEINLNIDIMTCVIMTCIILNFLILTFIIKIFSIIEKLLMINLIWETFSGYLLIIKKKTWQFRIYL